MINTLSNIIEVCDNEKITINLGKNPSSGGSPPKDNIRMGIIIVVVIHVFVDLLICASVFEFIKLNTIKIGIIRNEYKIKYINDWILSVKDIRANIHPMWVIDEYARIARSIDWFIPSVPPIIALREAITIMGIVDVVFDRINIITVRGASFCQVDRINAEYHEIDVIIEGYQVWHGAIPVFIISASRIIEYDSSVIGEAVYIYILPISRRLDPRAWINRYLMHASVSWELVEENIIGTNDSIFTSKANHSIIQFLLEIAIKALEIIVKIIIMVNGDFMFIKTWLESNHQIWVRSSYFIR